jgi:uncharacterized hydrophobic protein (TIGR00271 family)
VDDVGVVHLRLIVPSDLVAEVLERLPAMTGVAHVIHLEEASTRPPGQVVMCDVAREAANEVIEWLQALGVHHRGAISVEAVEAVISDAAAGADIEAPGHAADAVVWEELEAHARDDAQPSVSYLVFSAIAAVIAGVGVLLDAPILIVGAMVVGPEYGPVSALCVAAVRRRGANTRQAAGTLGLGLAAAAVAAFVATLVFRATGLAPDSYDLGDRELTAFISHPDGMAAVVAVLAGVVGMLSLTSGRSGTLVGVLVSVTTIPAVANIGVATAYREWSEVGGAALQLAVNLTGLVVAGIATLAILGRAVPSSGRVAAARSLS